MQRCCPVCQGTISQIGERWVLNHGCEIRVESDISIFFANDANMKYAPAEKALMTGLMSISQTSYH
jgi:hypothetical protein